MTTESWLSRHLTNENHCQPRNLIRERKDKGDAPGPRFTSPMFICIWVLVANLPGIDPNFLPGDAMCHEPAQKNVPAKSTSSRSQCEY